MFNPEIWVIRMLRKEFKRNQTLLSQKKKKVNPGIQGAGNGSMSKEGSLPLSLTTKLNPCDLYRSRELTFPSDSLISEHVQ